MDTITNLDAINNNLIIPKSEFGVPRALMPQIDSEHIKMFLKFLSDKGIFTVETTMLANVLKPTQQDVSIEKIKKIIKNAENKVYKRRIIVTSDNFVLDGHHRWLAGLNKFKDYKINVYKVYTTINKLLDVAREFPHTFYKSVNETYNYYREDNSIPLRTKWTKFMQRSGAGVLDMDNVAIDLSIAGFDELVLETPKEILKKYKTKFLNALANNIPFFYKFKGSTKEIKKQLFNINMNNIFEKRLTKKKRRAALHVAKKILNTEEYETFRKGMYAGEEDADFYKMMNSRIPKNKIAQFKKDVDNYIEKLSETKIIEDFDYADNYSIAITKVSALNEGLAIINNFLLSDNYDDFVRLTGLDPRDEKNKATWGDITKALRLDKPDWETDFRPDKYVYDFLHELGLDPHSQSNNWNDDFVYIDNPKNDITYKDTDF